MSGFNSTLDLARVPSSDDQEDARKKKEIERYLLAKLAEPNAAKPVSKQSPKADAVPDEPIDTSDFDSLPQEPAVDEERARLQEAADWRPSGWARGLAAAGAAAGGRDPAAAVRGLYGDADRAREDLVNYDKRKRQEQEDQWASKSRARQEQAWGAEDEASKSANDPNSEESRMMQELARRMGVFGGRDLSKIPASKLAPLLGPAAKQAELDARKQAAAAKSAPASYAQKLDKMSGEEKKRYDGAIMGLEAAREMKEALSGGSNTFSVVGDNDFTFARKKYTDAISRLQSGAALTDTEIKLYTSMAPQFTDSPEIREKKLNWIEREMERRIETLLGGNPMQAEQPAAEQPDQTIFAADSLPEL